MLEEGGEYSLYIKKGGVRVSDVTCSWNGEDFIALQSIFIVTDPTVSVGEPPTISVGEPLGNRVIILDIRKKI